MGEKKPGDRSMRQLASGQVSEVPGDKKDENLHHQWAGRRVEQ